VIELVRLLNFQCHRDLELRLGSITVLVGDNDAGKSSVHRALRWLALNQWDGKADEFITWGETQAQVSAVVDGRLVQRIKGAGSNLYLVDGEDMLAGRAGQDLPAAVVELLSLGQVNFQGQLDPAFWLMLNPSGAAEALNELFNLSDIDEGASRIASAVREANGTLKLIRTRQRAAQNEEKAFAWTLAAHKELAELEVAEQKINDLDQLIASSEGVLIELEEAESVCEVSGEVIDLGEEAVRVAAEAATLTSRVDALECILAEEQDLCQLQKTLTSKESRLRKLLEGTCPLCGRVP
jgi:exonuclease SbcC